MIWSKYFSNKLVDATFRGQAISFPAALYVAFLTSYPDANDGCTEIGNITANGYARVQYNPTAANWAATDGNGTTNVPSAGNSRKTSNNAAITFPNPSGGNWFSGAGPAASSIVAIALFDASTGGNLIAYLPCPLKTVAQTDTNIQIAAGALSVALDR